jgi:hypothetical protein
MSTNSCLFYLCFFSLFSSLAWPHSSTILIEFLKPQDITNSTRDQSIVSISQFNVSVSEVEGGGDVGGVGSGENEEVVEVEEGEFRGTNCINGW